MQVNITAIPNRQKRNSHSFMCRLYFAIDSFYIRPLIDFTDAIANPFIVLMLAYASPLIVLMFVVDAVPVYSSVTEDQFVV
jgi:hypothetical protein